MDNVLHPVGRGGVCNSGHIGGVLVRKGKFVTLLF